MTLAEAGIALAFFLFGAGYYFYWGTELQKRQKDLESEFLSQHQVEDNIPNDFIELTFEHRHATNLLNLCKQYHSICSPLYLVNKYVVERYEPKMEIHYIAFRRIATPPEPVPKPMPIEVIRCTEGYAIIATRDGHSAYLLEKGEPMVDGEGDVVDGRARVRMKFYIYTQFEYQETELGTYHPEMELLAGSQQSFFLGQTATNEGDQSPPGDRLRPATTNAPLDQNEIPLERKPSGKQD